MTTRILSSLLVILPFIGHAQCLDTLNFPTNSPNCHLDFAPVCGCDGVTYRNWCYAEGATVQQWTDGPCEQVAASIFPNPDIYWLNVSIVTKFESNVNIFIFDRNGNMAYSSTLSNVTRDYLTIPTNIFDQGMYVMMVECNGHVELLKFIRWEEQF